MAQTALAYDALEARLVTGRVLRAGDVLRVVCGNAAHDAFLAPSCLLEPREGDEVLLAFLQNGAQVVLAVLFRDKAAAARLRLPQDSAVECPGRLTLRGAQALDLQSGNTLRLEAEDLAVAAASATANVAALKTVSDTAEFCCRSLTTLGHTAVSVFRSLTQCLGSARRMVEGDDETHCANSSLVADQNASVVSKNSLSLAEETARTDAKLIQLG
jgi:hypothetical protein